VFDSCPAYQNSKPNVLFLSHCVPNPPDKGEKIRAYQEIAFLAGRCRLHLVCLARNEREVRDAEGLAGRCASLYVERFSPRAALLRAGGRFACGGCLNEAFYSRPRMRQYVAELAKRIPLDATVAYTTVMMPYAPAAVPILLDMVDVDSEKWARYAALRKPGFLYTLEARRLRELEKRCAEAAQFTLLTTENEAMLLRGIAPDAAIGHMENGVDGDFFDGVARPLTGAQAGRIFVAFVGTMDYHPNAEAAAWFSVQVFPELRRRCPELEFFIVGRNPLPAVSKLAGIDGVRVIGSVPDVRPYLAGARAIVAPLKTARGIQNKVLEGLAMGRRVFASEEVCRTFGAQLPPGVVRCATVEDYVSELTQTSNALPASDARIREAACERFSWTRNAPALARRLKCLDNQPTGPALCGLDGADRA
jgi:sugar transferase (PEP-CTERM/EpsH1 system associated)